MAQLQRTFALLLLSDRGFVDPSDMLQALFQASRSFEIGVQEDITELNNLFINNLEAALKSLVETEHVGAATFANDLERLLNFECIVQIEPLEAQPLEASPSMQPRMVVETCSHINLFVEKTDNLLASLQMLCDWETIEGQTDANSQGEPTNVTTKSRRLVKSLPQVLMLPLQRIKFNRELGQAEKLQTVFRFPEEIDLSWLVDSSVSGQAEGQQQSVDGEYNYELLSVLMHRGGADSGHYWALVRDFECNRWLSFNDVTVSTVTVEEVLSSGAGEGQTDTNASFLVYARRGMLQEAAGMSAESIARPLIEMVEQDNLKVAREVEEWRIRQAQTAEAAAAAEETTAAPTSSSVTVENDSATVENDSATGAVENVD